MTDSSLSGEAKELLDDLAKALPDLESLDDGNRNLRYKHEQVSPFVEPLLEAVGLKVCLEGAGMESLLIRF